MTFVIERFDAAKTYAGFNQFRCGQDAIDKFVKSSLKKQVRQGLSVAYAVLEEALEPTQADRFVGFFTIANHAIHVSALSGTQLGSLPKTIPCVRLIMLGINQSDAAAGLGRQLMNHALDVVKLSAQNIGCFGLYLDADPKAVGFYLKLGFHLLQGDQSPNPSPMFIGISAIA